MPSSDPPPAHLHHRPAWITHTDGHQYAGLVRRWYREPGSGGAWIAVVDYHAPDAENGGMIGHWYLAVHEALVERRAQDWPRGTPRAPADHPPPPGPVS